MKHKTCHKGQFSKPNNFELLFPVSPQMPLVWGLLWDSLLRPSAFRPETLVFLVRAAFSSPFMHYTFLFYLFETSILTQKLQVNFANNYKTASCIDEAYIIREMQKTRNLHKMFEIWMN